MVNHCAMPPVLKFGIPRRIMSDLIQSSRVCVSFFYFEFILNFKKCLRHVCFYESLARSWDEDFYNFWGHFKEKNFKNQFLLQLFFFTFSIVLHLWVKNMSENVNRVKKRVYCIVYNNLVVFFLSDSICSWHFNIISARAQSPQPWWWYIRVLLNFFFKSIWHNDLWSIPITSFFPRVKL